MTTIAFRALPTTTPDLEALAAVEDRSYPVRDVVWVAIAAIDVFGFRSRFEERSTASFVKDFLNGNQTSVHAPHFETVSALLDHVTADRIDEAITIASTMQSVAPDGGFAATMREAAAQDRVRARYLSLLVLAPQIADVRRMNA